MNYEEKVIKDNEKMIWKLANHFYGVDKNDLYQAGVVGLLKALQKWQDNGSTKFSTYAHDYIFGEMYLLASNRNVKVSKDILRLYKKIEQARYMYTQKIGKVPNNLEMAELLGLSIEEVDLACSSANTILSLDNDNDEVRSYYETVGEDIDYDTKILIDDSFTVLSDDESAIIKSRYFEDLTQSEVAKKLNMTQVMVSRYEKKGISKMRDYLQI